MRDCSEYKKRAAAFKAAAILLICVLYVRTKQYAKKWLQPALHAKKYEEVGELIIRNFDTE
jgi:hypothetical protein